MKTKKWLSLLLFFGIFFVLQFFIGRVLRADINSFARIMMQELHQDINIDVLFLGDSHIYRAIDPAEFKKTTNKDCFIAAFPGEEIDGTYAILQEAYQYHPEIKEIFIDLDIEQLWNEDFSERTQLKHIYACSNYLKNRKIKFDYLVHATSPYYYINSSLEIGKNRINPKPKSVVKTATALLSGEYNKFKYPDFKSEKFMGRGHVVSYAKNKNTFSETTEPVYFSSDEVSNDYLETMDKIYNFCKLHDLKLTLITVPESPYKFMKYSNYTDIHNFMDTFAQKYNCDYLDFNYVKNDFLDLNFCDFYDSEHVNDKGAKKITDAFNSFLTTDEPENYFYEYLDKHICSNKIRVFGIDIYENEDKKGFSINPIAHLDETSEITYKIQYKNKKNPSENFEYETSEKFVKYPEHKAGTMTVNCYLDGKLQGSVDQKFNTNWIK